MMGMKVIQIIKNHLPMEQREVVGKWGAAVAKMASHAIFQYNVLAIDDTHNTWTNVFAYMISSGF